MAGAERRKEVRNFAVRNFLNCNNLPFISLSFRRLNLFQKEIFVCFIFYFYNFYVICGKFTILHLNDFYSCIFLLKKKICIWLTINIYLSVFSLYIIIYGYLFLDKLHVTYHNNVLISTDCERELKQGRSALTRARII